VADLRKYTEWLSRGKLTGRVAYVLKEWDLPKPQPGAEWQRDAAFNAAEEILARPDLKEVLATAIKNGAATTSREQR
jgi:hypothetical protein